MRSLRTWTRTGKTNLYSDPARWWGIRDDVKYKIANILVAR